MKKRVRWHEMFKDELEAAIEQKPICYFPYGLAEPHGPQSALGLDGLKAEAMLERFASEYGGVVAPTTWWHVSETPHELEWLSHQNAPRPFLTDVPPDLLYRQMVYHLRNAEAAGFRAAILVSGHAGGFMPDIKMVADIYSSVRPLRTCAFVDMDIITDGGFPDGRGHAGPNETSVLWAYRPELVDRSRFPDTPIEGKLFGTVEYARVSSRRAGERMATSQMRSLKLISDKLLADADGRSAGETISFEAAEEIWRKVLAEKPRWAAIHDLADFDRYMAERNALYPLPVRLEQ